MACAAACEIRFTTDPRLLDDEADAEDDDDEGGLRFNFEDDVAYKGPTAVVEEEDDEDDDDEDDDEQNGRAAVSCELGC